jgi:hypothetical protein
MPKMGLRLVRLAHSLMFALLHWFAYFARHNLQGLRPILSRLLGYIFSF